MAVYSPNGEFVRGYGVTDIDTREPVTPQTAFYIASDTKSFTAMAMNILHHRGAIDLDATLAKYAPTAPFPAAVRPEAVTLRNLLTHTSGIENQPIGTRSAYIGAAAPAKMWDLLSASQVNVSAPLGKFEYTNVGYNILTILTDHQMHVRWQDLLSREIFQPAGMTHTSASMSEARQKGWSIARPHEVLLDGGGSRRIGPEKRDATMQSAGGMVMSAEDAERWLELLINEGRIDGRQVIPADVVRETRQPIAKVNETYDGYRREAYGLGWYVSAYRGDPMIHHFGGFAGFSAHISYLPERKVGVAVFVNDSLVGMPLADAIANYIYDLEGGRLRDPNLRADAAKSAALKFRGALTLAKLDRQRRAQRPWKLTYPRSAYAGRYTNAVMGELVVLEKGGDLVAQLGDLSSVAEPYTQPDSIRLDLGGAGLVAQFQFDRGGKAAAVDLMGVKFVRN